MAQRNAAELYLAKEKGLSRPEEAKLVMNTFPAQGMNTTYDLTSVIPDSASTATAISCGHKTRSGVIGMDAEGKISYQNIVEIAKKRAEGRNPFHRIPGPRHSCGLLRPCPEPQTECMTFHMQLANSGVDYFAGGQLLEPVDKKDPSKPNAIDTAKKNGYTVAVGRAGFEA